jgi:hypothetical protein
MALLIGAALAVLSIAILVYPFLKARIRAQPEDSPGGADGDTPGLEAIYQEISTLRLEYQLGKVSEDVYRELLRGYRLQAAVALREQARAGTPRCDRGDGIPDRCPHCGATVGREDRACAACNASQAGSEGNAS